MAHANAEGTQPGSRTPVNQGAGHSVFRSLGPQ